ncbi:hypothetical protein K1719_002067 [Acacia pycnantha]|nr:hypothetical protein K1719_002067 [Acacia pycnantha]
MWRPKGSYQLIDIERNYYFASFDLQEDYEKVLTGGPWMIFGAYLTVQPWLQDFDPTSSAISKVVAWIRIPSMSFRYYYKSTLRAIGCLLGEVVKIDYMTEMRGWGRYACIAVLVDLLQPLVPRIMVDGRTYGVEYEGLPLICFECGRYRHVKERCQAGQSHGSEGSRQDAEGSVHASLSAVQNQESGHPWTYGRWLAGTTTIPIWVVDAGTNQGSRYNVLFEEEDLAADPTQKGQANDVVMVLSPQDRDMVGPSVA